MGDVITFPLKGELSGTRISLGAICWKHCQKRRCTKDFQAFSVITSMTYDYLLTNVVLSI